MSTFAGHSFHTMPRAAQRFPYSSSDTDHDLDMNLVAGHNPGTAPGRVRHHLRTTSTLSYQNSGPRDRDRAYSRSPRNLVVVTPPSDLPLNQKQLGNVLSMGPRHRLSQGILMPLFPSMFGQLNAIAREFNFPSTAGLCLYLHINKNGITSTPRISDDSWQYLFGHLFDGRPPSGTQQLPVGGSIEFDIDLNKARWFGAWVSGTSRSSDPILPPVLTSRGSLEAHYRGESQAVNEDEQPVEDRWNASGSHTLVSNSRPETLRHLPRKLSLVDRLELHGAQVASKSQEHPDRLDSSSTYGTYASSPILQPTIPQPTAENDLERRVNSWRATTELCPVSMVETYQPGPDAGVFAGITIMDEYALEHNSRQTVRVDEPLWSAPSVRPCGPTTEPRITSSRPSPVHLDRRVNGAVLPSPATVTSQGPVDDDCSPVVPSVTRLPSPDTGERMIEDVVAPRPRPVWENSFGWRPAVSWKQVYPYSFIQMQHAVRVQLQDSGGLMPPCSSSVICPSAGSQSDTQLLPNLSESLKSSLQPVWGISFGWQKTVTWRNVYPYSTVATQPLAPVQLCGAGGLKSEYPNLCIYPPVYPYSEIYPACIVEDTSQPISVILDKPSSYPSLVIYPAVYPHLDIYPQVVECIKMKELSQDNINAYSPSSASTLYPSLVIYPAIYPHFDLYPKALQISETLVQKEVNVKLVNVGCLAAEYPDLIVYPNTYPHLEIYPTRDTRRHALAMAWGVSFGWSTAKTWLQVYPLHITGPLTARQRDDDQSRLISRIGSESPISIHSRQLNISSSYYPYLIIYPSAYPHFDIYPSLADITEVEKSEPTEVNQLAVNPVLHYPNLLIYPVVYPHFDLYPTLVSVGRGKREPNLRRRRIEMWRAKTAAQVGVIELLANNHIWEADEPLQVNLGDYAWSVTSAGPRTSPLGLLDTSPISRSVHIDYRVQGSVLRTPSTATTWGPRDDDWYSGIDSIERLPSPDLGQRVPDDVENIEFPYQPWRMVWPLFESVNQMETLPLVLEQSVYAPEYSHPVIHPPTYPHFELYPSSASVSAFNNRVTETLANSNIYPVLEIYPPVYPHLNIYPAINLQVEIPSKTVSNVQHRQVEVRPASMHPDPDIYHACYPYCLGYIYPSVDSSEPAQIPVETSCGYPWLVIYPPVYPFVIPYPHLSAEINQPFAPEQLPAASPRTKWNSIDVKLPARYPLLDPYPAGYPWSLESIYPVISVDDHSQATKPQYSCNKIHPPVHPFVQLYPSTFDPVHIPETLDESENESAEASLATSELKPTNPVQDADVGGLATPPQRTTTIARRQRKTHMELHTSVFRSLGEQLARKSRTHLQLHKEVFQDGEVWTPSGCMQDLSSLLTDKQGDTSVPDLQQPFLYLDNFFTPTPSRSRSGTTTAQSPVQIVFPLVQPPALPPISPLRVRSPGIPSQLPLAVSETPIPRVSSPTHSYTHMRTTSARLSQAVKSMMPGGQRRNSNATSTSPPPEDHKERARSPTRFLPLVDRRPTIAPPPSHTHTPEFLTRVPRNSQTKESFVLQRARAYEQATMANQPLADTIGTKGTHSPFTLPSLPPMPAMSEVVEAIEKSKISFP